MFPPTLCVINLLFARYTLSWSVSELDRTARELERQIAEVDEKELAGGMRIILYIFIAQYIYP